MKKSMKQWMVYPVLAMGCLLGTAACGDDDDPASEPVAKTEFKLDAESVALLAEGGSSSVTYTLQNAGANSSVSAAADQEWVSNLKAATANKITFDVAANTSTEAREAKVTVTYSDDVNEDIKTSFIVKQAAGDPDFVLTVGETGSSWIQLSMIPKDANMRYMLAALPVDDMDGYISDEAFFENEMAGYQELADMYEFTLDEVVDILFAKGPVSDGYITLLEPEKEYYVYCYGITSDNELATAVIKQKVTTPAAASVNNTITIAITAETSRSVTADITTTTPDSYVLVYAPTEAIAALTDAQLTEELLNENYALEAGDNKGALFNNLSPDTEYTILAMGRAGGVATTGVVKAVCKTKKAQQGNVAYSLPDKKYFDGLEVQKVHPELFPASMTVTAEDAIIASNIKAEGASAIYTIMFAQETIDAEEEKLGREITDEEYINMAINNGDAGSSILLLVSYDYPLVLAGVALDADGNPGALYKESITITKSNISPVAEFEAYLAGMRMSRTVLPAANSSSMKSLLYKEHADGSMLKSFTVKLIRNRLKK